MRLVTERVSCLICASLGVVSVHKIMNTSVPVTVFRYRLVFCVMVLILLGKVTVICLVDNDRWMNI